MKALTPLLLLFLFALRLAAARGDDQPAAKNTDRCLSPYFLVKGAAENAEAFPLRSTKVTSELAGPVAEMIYRGEPLHPALVAEWRHDWGQAWDEAAVVVPGLLLAVELLSYGWGLIFLGLAWRRRGGF